MCPAFLSTLKVLM